MDKRPLLEVLAWIAGILSFVYVILPTGKEEIPTPESAPVTEERPAPQPEIFMIGSCALDSATRDGLNKNGLYNEIINLCSTGKASTIGQSLRIPSLSEDERFQYFNPVEFNNQHGLTDGSATKVSVYNDVISKISYCFSSSYENGASPLERIDMELTCLDKGGLKAQDKTFYLLTENAKSEGRQIYAQITSTNLFECFYFI